MIGFLSLPIRLLGIVFMAAFCVQAMAPLRSLNVTLFNAVAAEPNHTAIAKAAPPADTSSLLRLGTALVAIIAIWLVYQTWQQHMKLADGELRNRREAKR